jgi:predicted ATPase/class 3 adenylate cyclase
LNQLIPSFIAQKLEKGETSGSFEASIVSVDLSGFTALTERMMDKGSKGAEKLTEILSKVFDPPVALASKEGGIIPYFAGDSFLAIFLEDHSADSKTVALQFAIQSRQFFLTLPTSIKLGFRLGVAHGNVSWGIVGFDPKSYYFKGSGIHKAIQSQKSCPNQLISVDKELNLEPYLSWIQVRENNFIYPVDSYVPKPPSFRPFYEIHESITRCFIQDSIILHRKEGEFRTVISIFISFSGIDTYEELNAFAKIVLEDITNYSGYLKEIEFGDKGGVLACFFGAPVTFENITDRSGEFILSLKKNFESHPQLNNLVWKIGMTIGKAYCGFIGSKERLQYAMVGNCVNLAARLMTLATSKTILVDASIKNLESFEVSFQSLSAVKGISRPIKTYTFLGKKKKPSGEIQKPFVGRKKELQRLLTFFNHNTFGVAIIYGAGGMGKSALVHEFKKSSRSNWITARCDQILRKPFNPFIQVLRQYFSISRKIPIEEQKILFEKQFQLLLSENSKSRQKKTIKELTRMKSLLAGIIGIELDDSLWPILSPKDRYEQTIIAISDFLKVLSSSQPLYLWLEDIFWMDETSKKIVISIVQNTKNEGLKMILTSRFSDDGKRPELPDLIEKNAPHVPILTIALDPFSKEEVKKMGHYYLGNPMSEDLYDFIEQNTQNNPYYLDNLFDYFKANQNLDLKEGKLFLNEDELSLSYSMNAVLLSKLDRLSPNCREMVKVAGVFGRNFHKINLLHVLKKINPAPSFQTLSISELDILIKEAVDHSIFTPTNSNLYFFTQTLLQETAYEIQLPNKLIQTHEAIVETFKALGEEKYYFELAYHNEKAENTNEAFRYYMAAGSQAKHNFQNEKALEYFEKALSFKDKENDPDTYFDLLAEIFKLLTTLGKWNLALKTAEESEKLARKAGNFSKLADASRLTGEYYLMTGDYFEAKKYLLRAESYYRQGGNVLGIIELSGSLGNLYYRQSDYDQARNYFSHYLEQYALLRDHSDLPRIVSELGLSYMNQGEFKEAINVQKKYLDLFEKEGHFIGMTTLNIYIGVVYLEMGDYEKALVYLKEGQTLSKKIGNKLLSAIVSGNIGIVYEHKGDYKNALKHFRKDLNISEKLGDKEGISITLGLIGELKSYQGKFHKAIEYLQKSLMLAEEMNYPKGIAKSVNTLGDVFYFTGQLDRSIHFYDIAIKNARRIGSKPLLAYSLAEKGLVLFEMNKKEALETLILEAKELVKQLGHKNLIFDISILEGKLLSLKGEIDQAKDLFQKLLNETPDFIQKAALHFELFALDPLVVQHAVESLKLYQSLAEKTPKYIYTSRIAILQHALSELSL